MKIAVLVLVSLSLFSSQSLAGSAEIQLSKTCYLENLRTWKSANLDAEVGQLLKNDALAFVMGEKLAPMVDEMVEKQGVMMAVAVMVTSVDDIPSDTKKMTAAQLQVIVAAKCVAEVYQRT